MDIISEYYDAQKQLKTLDSDEKTIDDLTKSIERAIDERLRAFKSECDDKISKAKETKSSKVRAINDLRTPLKATVSRMSRLLDLMGIYKSNPEKPSLTEVPVKILHEDEHSIFILFITHAGRYSRQKVNPCTLMVRGRTIFGDNLTANGSEYRSWSSDEIKRAPTDQDLIEYMNRPANLKRIMDHVPLAELRILQEEYKEAIELLNTLPGQIIYWENQKEYYEDRYSHGDEKPEYAEAVKELKRLRKLMPN